MAWGDVARGGLEPLPDPIEWPRLPGSQARLLATAGVAIALGLGSALLVGWTLGTWEAAAIFAAVVIGAGAVGYAAALGRVRRGGGRLDWAMVRAILDSRSDALAITDASDRLVAANDAYGARTGGYASPFDLPGPTSLIANLAVQARRDGTAHGEVEIDVEGRKRRLRIACRPAEGTRRHLLWSVRQSATDRLYGNAVAQLEGLFGSWVGQAGLLAVMTNRQGMVLSANPAFREAVSHLAEPVNLGDAVVSENGRVVGLAAADGTTLPMRMIELPIQSGPDVPPEAYVLVFTPSDGQTPSGAVPVDTPDLGSLMAGLPLGVALADREGRLIQLNAAFAATAGVDVGDPYPHPTDLVVDEDKTLVSDAVRRAAGGYPKPREIRVRLTARPDEQVVLNIARVAGPGDACVALSLRDNREQLKLERQIAQATKMQAVGQLAGGVADDFNNSLTAVIGTCDLMLARHAPGDSDFDDINQIRQNANRAANLVRQLLAFSRQQTLRPQVLQISDVLGELSHLLKRLLGETIALTVKHGRNLSPVRADPGQLEQVIVNLAVNARDAMPDGGQLSIATYGVTASDVPNLGYEMMPPADYVAISVKDSGTGIPPNILGKIFEPFFTTKEFGKGTGLGLSTVYGIVKQTGGFIFADNVPDGGAEFTIYLPAAADVQRADLPLAPGAVEIWGKGTILLVEDEATVRAVAERALARKGYEVLTAGNGEEALELLDARPEGVDLLVSDVVMPTMDGPTLMRQARERFPSLRIVFMSGYAEEQLRKSIDVPGVAFLPKPFSVQELGDAVRAALVRDAG